MKREKNGDTVSEKVKNITAPPLNSSQIPTDKASSSFAHDLKLFHELEVLQF